MCYEVLREILRESRQFNAREFRILASQIGDRSCSWTRSRSRSRCSATSSASPYPMQVETSYGQEQFDIILV